VKRQRPAARLVKLLAPLLACWACRAASERPGPQDCAPPASEPPAITSARELAGEYRLKLVATSGAKAGSSTEGALTLQPQPPGLRYRSRLGGTVDSAVVHPQYGATEIDLGAIDAVLVGNTTSLDPTQPGVLVIERPAQSGRPEGAEIVLRLGSEANRQDRQRVDGGYTALRVRQLSPSAFSGTWGSGITLERSAGYFCAVREEGKSLP
jgi:hypothetical protein